MTTVATVLRAGGVFTTEWVTRLRAQCHRHLPPHSFRCLTDHDDIPGGIPLQHSWPGWWAKLELFRPDVFTGRVVYFDLDTLLVGDASPLFDYQGTFAALSDFFRPEIWASGVMAWDAAETSKLWEGIRLNVGDFRGRSDLFLNPLLPHVDRLQDLYPGLIGSYKAHKLQGGPGGFSVVCLHGEPKQPTASEWVQEAWR